jgi:hypothetical protein
MRRKDTKVSAFSKFLVHHGVIEKQDMFLDALRSARATKGARLEYMYTHTHSHICIYVYIYIGMYVSVVLVCMCISQYVVC